MIRVLRMSDVDLKGKRVLIREDLNVPVKDGVVSSDARIRASLPTIETARKAGARVLLMSHLGRPQEGVPAEEFSLAPVAARLSEMLGRKVRFEREWLDGVTCEPGEVVLLENVRFNKGEKKNKDELAQKMAALCDVYVMDAFATAHRAEASTHGVGRFAPIACAGPLLTSELEALEKALGNPKRPLVAIVGGSKVSTKLTVLETLLGKVDKLIVGGGIANTFLAAAGHPVGKSLHEADMVETARTLLERSKQSGVEIPLPSDVVVAKEFAASAEADVKLVAQVAADDMILDIGPDTAERFASALKGASTIVWNGPVGVFEFDQFGEGTRVLAQAVARSPAFSVAGGGDTIAAIEKYGVQEDISYISTAGGAFLEFLEGKTLPAVAMLEQRAGRMTRLPSQAARSEVLTRRTKIVATLGPATDAPGVLEEVIFAGADVLRVNFSHGGPADHRRRVERARQAAEGVGKHVALLGDLQGPKIRIERFAGGHTLLTEGATFTLDPTLDSHDGTDRSVGMTYTQLAQDVAPGDELILGDGQIELVVTAIQGDKVECRVLVGGELGDQKGINRRGGGLSAKALTDKDREDVRLAASLDIDYLAVSFVRQAADIDEARNLLSAVGSDARIVAKIERSEAIPRLDEIVKVSDAVMVARGDLGIEVGYAELTGLQKHILQVARKHDRVTITATQMMESMIQNPVPTRAEVSDVANAVLDGSDAVMLSGESAVGKYPVRAVEAMSEVIVGAEKYQIARNIRGERFEGRVSEFAQAIAHAVMYTANHMAVEAIVALTESGATPLWMSRIRSDIPIFAFTRNERTRRRVALYRGVYPIPFDITHTDPAELYKAISRELIERKFLRSGDEIILTLGEFSGVSGGTNTMKLLEVSA